MLRKIFHVIAFVAIASLVTSVLMNNDPDDASKQAAQLPALLIAGLYVGFMFVMYVLPALTTKATNAVLASNETVSRAPIHIAQAAYARGEIDIQAVFRARERLGEIEFADIEARKAYFLAYADWMGALGGFNL